MQHESATPYILSADWVAVITEELVTKPACVPFSVEPEAMGCYDLMLGRPCDPTAYYRSLADVERYLIAYKDGAQAWAARVEDFNAAQRVHVLTDDEADAELADLVEGMLDAEWHSRGMW